MMPLLLDSCMLIWIIEEKPIKPAALAALDFANDNRHPVFISPITALEFGMLFSCGRIRSPLSPQEYWRRATHIPGVQLAPMPPELLMASWFLPDSKIRDPWDRIIAATAREYGYTVLTRHRALLSYAKEGHLSALEC
jgi:PIN domain nuclease of toxin-antitoxin system